MSLSIRQTDTNDRTVMLTVAQVETFWTIVYEQSTLLNEDDSSPMHFGFFLNNILECSLEVFLPESCTCVCFKHKIRYFSALTSNNGQRREYMVRKV